MSIKEDSNPVKELWETMERQGAIFYSKPLQKLSHFIIELAKTEYPVLIEGATGTGKEMLAKSIHAKSKRRDKDIIVVNCGGLNEKTIISDLFGHEKGAFTDAHEQKKGAIERADGGTLFLDEIGDLPKEAQTALLRFLNDGTYQRLGKLGINLKSNVRVICATNKNLWHEVKQENFREDLFYRINVFYVRIPSIAPLNRERAIQAFQYRLSSISKKNDYKLNKPLFTEKAFELLMKYTYPGNYREMENILVHAIVKSNGDTIHPKHLPDYLIGSTSHDIKNELLSLPPAEFRDQINRLLFVKFDRAYNEFGSYLQAAKAFGFNNTKFKRILDKSREGKAL